MLLVFHKVAAGCFLLSLVVFALSPSLPPTFGVVHAAFISSAGSRRRPRRLVGVATTPRRFSHDKAASSASKLALQVNSVDGTDLVKNAAIVLFLFGGLIPATISANIATVQALTGESRKNEGDEFVADSGATGPTLAFSNLMLTADPIVLADVIAVVGRLTPSKDSIADWKNLPSAQLPGTIDSDNPPQWLPRSTFKERIRTQNQFTKWPVDAVTGQPVGGQALKEAEEARISKRNAVISDAALDIVFDTWAGGSSVATPDKVEQQLALWRRSDETFQLDKFTGAALRSRAITLTAALTFVAIQVVAYCTLFIAPVLRQFFNLDIGFGQLGECVGTCSTLF